MTIHSVRLGIDVSKATLDVYDEGSKQSATFANDPEGIEALVAALTGRDVLVVMEATGRHDRRLRAALATAGVDAVRVNPERARSFARAIGLLAKTDTVDARMLAQLGRAIELRPDVGEITSRDMLSALAKRRDQLVDMRVQEKNRHSENEAAWGDSLARHLAWLKQEIAELNRQIAALIRSDADLERANRLLRSIPGVGPVTATTLLAQMPELGRLTPKTVAALAGLCPFNCDSGTLRGQRRIAGGRRRVREALYMAALAAKRVNHTFRAFHEGLTGRGKAFKVAAVATARKLLVTANAVLRDGVPFRA